MARAPELVNPNLSTGEVELRVETLEIVSTAPPLPFQLDEEGVDETLRLRYRWLDLRREKLQRNIRLRSQMVSIIRRVMESAGFLDIQTPILVQAHAGGRAGLRRSQPAPARAASTRCRSRRRSSSSCSSSPASTGTTRSPSASGTRICARIGFRRSRQLDVEMAFPDREFIIDLHGADGASGLASSASTSSSRFPSAACRTTKRCFATARTSPICGSASRSRT